MKTGSLIALSSVMLGSPAIAQTPGEAPAVGAVVDSFQLIADRTVWFEPNTDGKLRIVKVIDADPHAQMPKVAGQVAIAMTYAPEIGTVVEYNSGLDFAFAWTPTLTGPTGANAPGEACPVGKGLVGSEQWPQPYPIIRFGGFKRHEGKIPC